MKPTSCGPSGTKKDDRGVSPVIAVILMVAITVVLAATVYVWVTQFNAGGQTQPGMMSLSQTGGLNLTDGSCGNANATWCAKWVITSITPDFPLSRLNVRDTSRDVGTITCTATDTTLGAGTVLSCTGQGTEPLAGDTFLFIDRTAGSAMVSVILHA